MKKIVFDVDDTLWALNKKVCEKTGILYEKFSTFLIYENPLLTESEKKQILLEYGNPELFKNISWFKGIKRIKQLKNVDIYINSNNLNQKCAENKFYELQKILNLPEDHIIMNITGKKQKNIKKKKIDEDTYIFVDDSPHNIAMSSARYNIMIRTPWNQSESAKKLIKDKNVIFCSNLNELIDTIEKIS